MPTDETALTTQLKRPTLPWSSVTLYVGVVILGGVPAFVHCLLSAVGDFRFDWLYFGVLVLAASFFPITVPTSRLGKQSFSFTVSDVFVFSALLLYSPEVAALLCLLDAVLNNIRSKVTRLYKVAFNLSHACLSALLAGKLFYFFMGTSPPLDPDAVQSHLGLLLYMDLTGLIYFFLSSGAVALAIALATRQPVLKVLEEDVDWTAFATVASVSLATLLFLVFDRLGIFTFALAILPMLLLAYGTFRLTSQRVNDARRHLHEVGELHRSTISSLALAIDAKDECTHGHVHRVQAIALGLAEFAGLKNRDELRGLWAAALLHDIGKLATPEFVLNKPTSLTEWEMKKMREHAAAGAQILSSIPFPYEVVPLVRSHHEKWDGTGYPDGLKGEEIPLGARIISIADCYDALTSDRPYRCRLTRRAALDFLESQAGKSYDPRLIQVLVKNIESLEALLNEVEKGLPPSLTDDYYGCQSAEEGGVSETLFFELAVGQAKVMHSMSASLQQQLPLRETLDLLWSEIGKVIDYDAAVIYLLEARTDRLRPVHAKGASAKALRGLSLKLGEGISGWVAANRQPLYNLSPSPDFYGKKAFLPLFESCLSIPLALNEQVMGTMTLYSKRRDAYADIQRQSLIVLSRLAVLAINDALVNEEFKRLPVQLRPTRWTRGKAS